MKVCFLKDIPRVAKAGEIKEVSDGYYRNFLVPKKLARPASGSVLKQAAAHRQAVVRHAQKEEAQMKTVAKALDGFHIVVHAQASPEGTLFGGVHAGVIVEALKKAGHIIEPQWVQLEHSIKKVGSVPVALKLPYGKKATVRVEIAAQ